MSPCAVAIIARGLLAPAFRETRGDFKPYMSYSVEDCKEWVEQEMPGIMIGLAESKEIPEWMRKSPVFLECWKAGCWLNFMLKENGATPEEVAKIGFCHGQRSLFGDTYKCGVEYLNEFVETKSVADQPGNKLADEINREHFTEAKETV